MQNNTTAARNHAIPFAHPMLERFPRTLKALRRAVNVLRSMDPARRQKERAAMTVRLRALAALDRFSRQDSEKGLQPVANVLIDGTWDNPNYWFRYSLFRRSLGLSASLETGLIGKYSRGKVRTSLNVIGIDKFVDFASEAVPTKAHRARARSLLSNAEKPDDLLHVQYPHGFPSEIVFDGILKRQREATVNLADPQLSDYVAEVLGYLDAANNILDRGRFDLVVLSHSHDYTCGSIAWAAICRGIPVVVLCGDYGASRFLHLRHREDLFAFPGRPTIEELIEMPQEIQNRIRSVGAAHLHARVTGRTDDLGSVYAYQRRSEAISKAMLCKRFGWAEEMPIIGVYNSNWFDYPHGGGLHYFRDYLDWIEQTLKVAKSVDSVNWLFKAHPCDDWYNVQGISLEDLVGNIALPHIQVADKSWNGQDLIEALDGIVTCQGTIGIEAAAQRTPVLVSHTGWYGHAGFVVNPDNREGYLATLRSKWWDMKGAELKIKQEKAEYFAGWVFCIPSWHGTYVMKDDSHQEAIYPDVPAFIDNNQPALQQEVSEIRNWFFSNHKYFQIFKNARAVDFQAPS